MNPQIQIEQEKTGVYTLLIELKQEIKIKVGKLGVCEFRQGIYTYTGSALGKGATDLRGRLQRHISITKNHHWHIDYLLSADESHIKHIIFFETSRQEECNTVKELISLGGKVNVKGFGASDCRAGCNSHLLFFENNDRKVLGVVKKAYEAITTRNNISELFFG